MKVNISKNDNVSFITLHNNKNMTVVLSTFGASFYDIQTPDRNGVIESIVLTPKDFDKFLKVGYYGKSVGRFSGRIDEAKCVIDGVEYNLEKNWGKVNSLHGGVKGISYCNFDYQVKEEKDYVDVVFTYLEKENFLPGDVNYIITYRVYNDCNEVKLIFNATTTKKTICNLTNHVFFNLSGNGKRNCLDHNVTFLCDRYTRLNNNLITLSIDKVTPVMDFRDGHKLGKYIYDESLQNHRARGYDHCWFKEDRNNPLIAIIEDKESGRKLSVSTSYPSIVSYVGCYPDNCVFNGDFTTGQYHSICVECQNVPNGINMDNVEKSLLDVGEVYNHYIHYKFE